MPDPGRVTREALAEVFGSTVVEQLRPDSILMGPGLPSSIGMVPADAIAVCDAVDARAHRAGAACVLDAAAFASDAEGDPAVTLADLEAAIRAAWQGSSDD